MYITTRKYDCDNCLNRTKLLSGEKICKPMQYGMECVDIVKKSKDETYLICYEYRPMVKEEHVKN